MLGLQLAAAPVPLRDFVMVHWVDDLISTIGDHPSCMTGHFHSAGDAVLPVSISSWEIECCAPAPEVGGIAGWRLTLQPPAPEPEFNCTVGWTVTGWAAEGSRVHCLLLRRGDLTAAWPDAPELADGVHQITGQLVGSRHGGSDFDGVPPTQALVRRVRLVSRQVTLVDRKFDNIAGTTKFTDVQKSPKWFTLPSLADGGSGVCQSGVLIDLAVRRAT